VGGKYWKKSFSCYNIRKCFVVREAKNLVYFKKASIKSFWNGINDDKIDVHICLRLLCDVKETIAFSNAIIVAAGTGPGCGFQQSS